MRNRHHAHDRGQPTDIGTTRRCYASVRSASSDAPASPDGALPPEQWPLEIPAPSASDAFRWERTHIGLVLYDGVGEIELASIVDLHPRTYSNIVHPLTLGNVVVETRHGLHLVARRDVAGLDRIVLPGEASSQLRRSAETWATEMGLQVDNVHGDGFAFDAALRDIAEHSSHAEARLVATGAEYPGQIPAMTGSGWPWALVLRPLLLGAAGIATAAAVGAARRHRQTGPSPS